MDIAGFGDCAVVADGSAVADPGAVAVTLGLGEALEGIADGLVGDDGELGGAVRVGDDDGRGVAGVVLGGGFGVADGGGVREGLTDGEGFGVVVGCAGPSTAPITRVAAK